MPFSFSETFNSPNCSLLNLVKIGNVESRKELEQLKNWKKSMASVVTILILASASSVKAAEVKPEEYERLRNVFSDARISVMTDEEVEKYLEYDLENASTETVYYKGVSKNNESYTWTEVSEEEYNTGDISVSPDGTYYATTYKEECLSVVQSSSTGIYTFALRATWRYIPTVRSFDVIAFRFRNIAIYEGTQSGTQIYKKSGASSYSYVAYSPYGTNISKQEQGFGISMNIVDDDITALECSIEADGLASGSAPYVFGNYQHATKTVTLAQSQSYTISAAGYGNVINFAESIASKYDGMSGVYKAL